MDTSVAQVTVDGDGGITATGICHAKNNDNQLMLKGLRVGMTLHARALSASQAVLYRAELRLADPLPAVIDLPLYYTGGE